MLRYDHQLADARALVRDRGSQFIGAFDEIFRTERMKILTTAVRTPVANAFAERWIGTLRRELLDRTIIWNRRQLNNLALVRDRGSQFIGAFDEIFRTERMKILTTAVRTPVANAFAERWIGTLPGV